MEGIRWQAEPAPRLSPDSLPTLSSSNYGQEWLQHQSERLLQKVENTIKQLTVDVEDLQELVRLNRNSTISSRDSRKTSIDNSFLFRGDLQFQPFLFMQWLSMTSFEKSRAVWRSPFTIGEQAFQRFCGITALCISTCQVNQPSIILSWFALHFYQCHVENLDDLE